MINEELLRQEYERGFVDGMGRKKMWVELTHEECFDLCETYKNKPFNLLLVVQAALKEKNT